MKLIILISISLLVLSGCSSNESIYENKLTLVQKIEKANVAFNEARLDKAESLFLQIVKDKPRYIEAWLKLGNIYVRQERFKAAIRCFEEAIKIDKADGRAWYNLALVRIGQATKTLETAEQIVPIDSPYQTYLLKLHKKLLN